MNKETLITRKNDIEKELLTLEEKLTPKILRVQKLENNIKLSRKMISRPYSSPESRLDIADKINRSSQEQTILLKEVLKLKMMKHQMLGNIKLIVRELNNA